MLNYNLPYSLNEIDVKRLNYYMAKSQWIVWLLSILDIRHTLKITTYYGGSIVSDIGGPLVKLKRLKKLFSQNIFNFKIVYILLKNFKTIWCEIGVFA